MYDFNHGVCAPICHTMSSRYISPIFLFSLSKLISQDQGLISWSYSSLLIRRYNYQPTYHVTRTIILQFLLSRKLLSNTVCLSSSIGPRCHNLCIVPIVCAYACSLCIVTDYRDSLKRDQTTCSSSLGLVALIDNGRKYKMVAPR